MNVLICHERFMFRYGADRVFILVAQGLRRMGHQVTMMANRFDPAVLASVASRVIEVPADQCEYGQLDEFSREWLGRNWDALFSGNGRPDLVLAGGWPFFSSIRLFRHNQIPVVFSDHGAVPLDGYPPEVVQTLTKLRALRREFLRDASCVVGVSRFIVDSQSRPDTSDQVPVHVVANGADHLESGLWSKHNIADGLAADSALDTVRALKREGRTLILALGRWEPGTYKNSEAALDVARAIRRRVPDATLLVLARPEDVQVDPEWTEAVRPLGFPSDSGLKQIMSLADLGVSTSLWEGFNLPVAEMQWLGRPCLALDLAAHPETLAHPWFLCRDSAEMGEKACALFSGDGPASEEREEALDRFRRTFTWDNAVRRYAEVFESLIEPRLGSVPNSVASLVIDTTNSLKDPANSGVVRVARRLGRELQGAENPLFVFWEQENHRFVLPVNEEFDLLAKFSGPSLAGEDRLSRNFDDRQALDHVLSNEQFRGLWLILPEVRSEKQYRAIRAYARARGMKIAAIFYDSIPLLRPDLCEEEIRNNHGAYMRGLAECDLVIPISRFSASCLDDFWRAEGIPGTLIATNLLPGEFGGSERAAQPREHSADPFRILCVSTLEPRKNHRGLIVACRALGREHPELNWQLTLVGNRYAGSADIAEFVERAAAEEPRIRWLGIVDDAELARLYQECQITVYPSTIEGYGLPIMESVWHGRPCVCSGEGVMGELAVDGGCLTADVNDPASLGAAIYRLASEPGLYHELSEQAVRRPIKSWGEYVTELRGAIGAASVPGRNALISDDTARRSAEDEWNGHIYPGCLVERWQMSDSERMALTGLLSRHNPRCALEIGTYWGGSLSLLSQYCGAVISVDIDAEVAHRLPPLPNVTLLTGASTEIVPALFMEAKQHGLPIDFILIDADHSAEGVKRDIRMVLEYEPEVPLVVILHDSFNPECRRGMIEAGWEQSRFCRSLDLDFVPGRVVSDGSPFDGQLWGGFAAAYFTPEPREGSLEIRRSADAMWNLLQKSAGGADCPGMK